MLRDRPHLCNLMPRRKDARRLQADPDHEPDLYLLSRILPLDDSITPTQESLRDVHRPYPREICSSNVVFSTHTAASTKGTPATEQQWPPNQQLSPFYCPSTGISQSLSISQHPLYQAFSPTQPPRPVASISPEDPPTMQPLALPMVAALLATTTSNPPSLANLPKSPYTSSISSPAPLELLITEMLMERWLTRQPK
mmetsp:Transcript_8129/g.15508  ORF Transcript_8129/g.15508 Transcript_8129/m.15508 type:complete len:197 (-) Transcript_8129:36-626(-)